MIYYMRLLFVVLPLLFSCMVKGQSAETGSAAGPDTVSVISADSLRMLEVFPNSLKKVRDFLKKTPLYHPDYAFMIDMKRNSGTYRFFIVDLKNNRILERGLVAHGSGSELTGTDSLQFSNTPNSYMTSLGFYKIGAAYTGNFGRSYRLHGLESSNNRAYERAVVLHRYSCVPDEQQDYPICNSLGCPMVSERFFETLDGYVRNATKPVLLYIYY